MAKDDQDVKKRVEGDEMQNKPEKQDEEMVFDTSKMTEGQQQAMEVAEAARETEWTRPSFASKLFMGDFDFGLIREFPEQNPEDKKIGDEFIAKLEDFLVKNLDPEEVDRNRKLPKPVIDGLFKLGVFGMKVPQKYGGLEFSQVNYCRVAMALASYCGATATMISAHQSIGVPNPLKMFGTEEQKAEFFPRLAERSISAFALTEPDVGSDPAQMKTTAVPTEDGQHFIINGEKLWCTNGTVADLMVVMAQTPPKMVRGREKKQITAFIVEATAPGIEVKHRCHFMGLGGIENALMTFKDVKVPRKNILWAEGRGLALALRTLNTGRLTLPAASAGLGKMALAVCRRWGNERSQWGKPIAKHEAGAQKIAYIASTTFAIEAITLLTSHWTDQGEMDLRIEAAMAKLFTTEQAWKIIDTTMQFRGGRGYERADSLKARGENAYGVERAMRDCRINMILEGSSEIMRLFLAREAMDPHLRLAGDLINPRTSASKKVMAMLKAAAFYSTWLPKRYLNLSIFSSYPEMGELGKHFRFIERTAHKMARTYFIYMGLYQDRLEKKQMLLARLVEAGTELFAMATTCSYAVHLSKKKPGEGSPIELANHFSTLATRRINDHLRALSDNDDEVSNKLSKSVMDGNAKWMEEGIIWTGPKD